MTCGHGAVVTVIYESRWQKHWACEACGEEFFPHSAIVAMKSELDQFKADKEAEQSKLARTI
jgi:hypothetical protein